MTAPKRRWILSGLFMLTAVFMVFAIHFAIGPRRYLQWRWEIHEGQITEDELRQDVGEENYRAYREYIDSVPPLPPR